MIPKQPTELRILQSVIAACNIHAARLELGMNKIACWMPATAEKLAQLSDEMIGFLDLFSTRFTKLQDLMGNKLFPLILLLIKDPGSYPTFIDIVARLEKIGALSSAQQWFRLREIRNAFTHDYPEESDQRAYAINEAYEHAQQLLNTYQNLLIFINRYQNL